MMAVCRHAARRTGVVRGRCESQATFAPVRPHKHSSKEIGYVQTIH
jgi:hypothetical protein